MPFLMDNCLECSLSTQSVPQPFSPPFVLPFRATPDSPIVVYSPVMTPVTPNLMTPMTPLFPPQTPTMPLGSVPSQPPPLPNPFLSPLVTSPQPQFFLYPSAPPTPTTPSIVGEGQQPYPPMPTEFFN